MELKELKGYLGYGLKCHTSGEYVKGNEDAETPTPLVVTLMGIKQDAYSGKTWADLESDQYSDSCCIEDVFPHLHPLSDLTKPCLAGDKIPIIELAKIIADIHNDDLDAKWGYTDNGRIIVRTPWDLRIEMFYKTETICWAVYNQHKCTEERTKNQSKAIDKLYEWHFDIHGLIEKKEAIDINTLNQ